MNAITSAVTATLRPEGLWISWERHRRSRELSRALGAELIEVISTSSSPLRYLELISRTTAHLMRRRPSILLIQCPSIVLGIWVVLVRRVFGYTLVADLHNEAVVPFNNTSALYRAGFAWIRRMADVSLVSNDALKGVVDRSGGRALVLPDLVPALAPDERPSGSRARVVFICTYAPDEPFREVIEAAGTLGDSVELAVTGNPGALRQTLTLPANVHLTGYLPDRDYERMLQQAEVIVDLTAMEDCLVCGAYEAVALETPLVTSDTAALRAYFHRGAVYTRHDPAAIAEAISEALTHRQRLGEEMRTLKQELLRSWRMRLDAVSAALKGGGR